VISPRVGWHVSLDGAKVLNLTKNSTVVGDSTALRDANVDQRSRILQEASIYVAVTPTFRVDVGQQIIPVSLEGVTPSSQIETIERTMFIAERTRGGGISDVRDIGAAARGSVAAGYVDYQIGLFNEMGDSQNSTDQNVSGYHASRFTARASGSAAQCLRRLRGRRRGTAPRARRRGSISQSLDHALRVMVPLGALRRLGTTASVRSAPRGRWARRALGPGIPICITSRPR
jgi:hypothetical protein